ncbi:type VI secretion system baseplate subunit TssK [Xanthomonas sp. NCPPB 2632]|uniref:type VI secretion system baseplate subunit TssK n=1 Tax=Xanthomonas sp. NCPPB 2632 TaxID=3240912 RepID=UPI003511762B
MNTLTDNLPDVPDAVSWSEGMLLSPQHFQQNDIYWHALLQQRLSTVQPRGWGLLDLAIDPTELARGVVRITRVRAVMRDGLLVDHEEAVGAAPLQLDLSGHGWIAEPNVTVHLCVPVRGKGAANVHGEMQRYTTVAGDLVADEHTGRDEIAVDRLRPVYSLMAGDAVPRSYSSFPLLRLTGDARGVGLAPFHPPLLRLEAAAVHGERGLDARLKRLSVLLWAKYRELMGAGVDRAERRLASESHAQVRAARFLVTVLPGLDVLLQSGEVHPFEAYKALAGLVGVLAASDGAPQPPALGGYDHDDCLPQFERAFRYIDAQLTRLNADYEVYEFRRVGVSGFQCVLPPGMDTARLLIELRPAVGETAQTLHDWINTAAIGTDDLVSTLVRRRDTGAPVTPADAGEVKALNLPAGSFVYGVAQRRIDPETGPPRALLVAGRTLVILGEPGSHVPTAITLYVPRVAAGH